MAKTILVTGSKYDSNVKLVLGILLLSIVVVVFAASGLVPQIFPSAELKLPPSVSEVNDKTVSQSTFDSPILVSVLRKDGAYSFAKIENATLKSNRYSGEVELTYQNGDSGIVTDNNGVVDVFISKLAGKQEAFLLDRGVTGVTLPDRSILPVRVVTGNIVRGKLVGNFELLTLTDNKRILGKFDTRGKLSNVSVVNSLEEPNVTTGLISKEILRLSEVLQGQSPASVLGISSDAPSPAVLQAATDAPAPVVNQSVAAAFYQVQQNVSDGSLQVVQQGGPATVPTTVVAGPAGPEGPAGPAGPAGSGGGDITGVAVGDGLAGGGDSGSVTVGVKLNGTASAISSSTSSGLELSSDGLSLLRGCSNGQVLSWNSTTLQWVCSNSGGTSAGVSSLNSLTGALSVAGGGINSVSASGSTITVTGTLPNVGTSGTYGSSTTIPVLTTDAQGRVSGVTNTTISGLTTSSFSSSNISQWTNNSGYITTSSSDVLSNKTISGSSNTLSNIGNSSLTNSSLTVTAGNGLTGGGSVSLGGSTTISANITSSGTSANTSANSGLEVSSSGLALLRGCSNGQVLAWNSGTSTWGCSNVTASSAAFSSLTSGTNSIAAMVVGTGASLNFTGTGTINASTLNGNTFTNPGAIGSGTAAAGTFTTLTGNTSITDGGLTTNGVVTNTAAGLLGTLAGTTTTVLHGNAAGLPTFSSVTGSDLAANITISTTGNISTTGTGTITSAGLLTGSNGLTISSGSVSLPNGSIANAALANSSLTVTAGTGLSGGGLVSLGGTTTLSLPNVGTAATYGSALNIPVFTTDAQGRITTVTNTAISGLTTSNLSATAGITNGQLANSSITVTPTAGTGISVSGSPVSLGGTLTIAGVDATTTTKGVASFNSTNFSVTSGAVNTVQNINSSATPSFSSLSLTNTTNQLVLGTTNTTTISSTAPSANRVATIPALTANDNFVFENFAATLTNKTISGASNTLSNIGNSSLTNSSLTVTAGTGLSGGGLVSLGGTTTLSLPNVGTAATYGNATTIPVITTDAQGRVSGVTNTAISGLTTSNLSATAGITNGQLANSLINTAGNSGTGSVSLGGTLTLTGAGITSIAASSGTLTVTSTEADTLNSVTGRGNTTGNSISTTGTGAITSAGTLTASNGLTLTTGALNLTASSGALSLSGLGASSINTGANALTITSSNFNTTATGINSTAIGQSTAAAGTFTALTSTGTSNIGSGTGVVTVNSSGALNLTGAAPSTLTLGANALTLTASNFNISSGGIVTLAGAQSVDLTSPAGVQLTVDSGTTGDVNFGTGAVAKNVNLGNTTGTTTTRIKSGTGGTLLFLGPTSSSSWFQVGNSNTSTPDLLVQDFGTADPTGANGGSYYNTSTNKFRCYENNAWKDCDTNTSTAPRLDQITSANTTATLSNGDNAQTWDWALTTAAKTAFSFGESSASTNGAGSQYILGVSTLASSTAAPFKVSARANTIIDTTSTGGLTFGNTTANTPITLQSGTGNILIGNDANAKAITIGNSTAGSTLSLIANGASSINTGANALTITSSNFNTTATGINSTAIGQSTAAAGTFTTLTGNTSITDGGLTTNGVVTNTAAGLLGTLAGTTTTVLHGNAAGLPTFSSVTGSDLAANITISTTGNISTTGTGTITSAGTLTASNGLTMTTGALSLTSTSGSISSTGLTGLTQTLSSGTAAITAPTLNLNTSSTGNTAIGNGTGTFALTSNGGLNVTTGGALTGVASIDTIGTTATSLTFAGTGTLSTTNADLNLVSGTGNINIGIANQKNITIGNATGTTNVNLLAGTGNVTVGTSDTTGTLLVLDTKTGSGDPTGANGGMYYNSNSGKFRCFENNAWKDCISTGSNVKFANSTTTSTLTTTETSYLSVTITPSSTSNNVWIVANAQVNDNNISNGSITTRIRRGNTCDANSQQVDGDVVNTFIKQVDASAAVMNFVDSPSSASATTYQFCALSSAANLQLLARQITVSEVKLGADLAEVYNSTEGKIESGSVVSLDSSVDGGAKKSSKSYDQSVLGVVSSNPGMLLSQVAVPGTTPVMVAMSGRVPVKVSTENGEIKAGDYLTSSSVPGVAMKATKTGAIVGTALTGFNGEGVGQVVVFVKNGVSNGSNIAGSNVEVLSNLVNLPQPSATTDISNITTDKVVAGLELITPKITTQDILATGLLVMTDANGNENVRISSTGDASLSGTLVVDTLKARRIEGMDVITKKLSLLSDEVAGVATSAAQPIVSAPTETNILDLISKAISDIYKNASEFFGKVIFHNDVAFLGRPTFNKDTAGFALVRSGDNEVEVKFEREYTSEPVVNISLNVAGAIDMNNLPTFAVADVSTKGFKIRMSKAGSMDLRFSWMAIAVTDAKNVQSNGGTTQIKTNEVKISPDVTPTPTASLTPSVTPEVTAQSQESTTSAVISPAVTPTEAISTSITQTEQASSSASN